MAAIVHDDAAARELGARPGRNGLDLGAQLARQPFVVIITEGNELSREREYPGVARAGQARRAAVADHLNLAADGQALVRLAAVVNENRPQLARVVLGKHG